MVCHSENYKKDCYLKTHRLGSSSPGDQDNIYFYLIPGDFFPSFFPSFLPFFRQPTVPLFTVPEKGKALRKVTGMTQVIRTRYGHLDHADLRRASFDSQAWYPNWRIKSFRRYLIPITRSDCANVQLYFLAQNDFHWLPYRLAA